MQKEILFETLTHIFFMDGTKASKIESVKPAIKTNRVKSNTWIDISKTDGSAQEVDRLIRILGIPDGVVVCM